jgi:hypothetical protein
MNKLENYNPPIDMKWTNVWQPPTVFKSEHLGIDDENGKYVAICDDHHFYIQGTLKYLNNYEFTFMFCSECARPDNYSEIMKELHLINQ